MSLQTLPSRHSLASWYVPSLVLVSRMALTLITSWSRYSLASMQVVPSNSQPLWRSICNLEFHLYDLHKLHMANCRTHLYLHMNPFPYWTYNHLHMWQADFFPILQVFQLLWLINSHCWSPPQCFFDLVVDDEWHGLFSVPDVLPVVPVVPLFLVDIGFSIRDLCLYWRFSAWWWGYPRARMAWFPHSIVGSRHAEEERVVEDLSDGLLLRRVMTFQVVEPQQRFSLCLRNDQEGPQC